MTDRESHRAAVEAGYADLAAYIDKWKMDEESKRELLAIVRGYYWDYRFITDRLEHKIRMISFWSNISISLAITSAILVMIMWGK